MLRSGMFAMVAVAAGVLFVSTDASACHKRKACAPAPVAVASGDYYGNGGACATGQCPVGTTTSWVTPAPVVTAAQETELTAVATTGERIRYVKLQLNGAYTYNQYGQQVAYYEAGEWRLDARATQTNVAATNVRGNGSTSVETKGRDRTSGEYSAPESKVKADPNADATFYSSPKARKAQ